MERQTSVRGEAMDREAAARALDSLSRGYSIRPRAAMGQTSSSTPSRAT
jgi:hypothetical protein